jgi:putative acetyltransferase
MVGPDIQLITPESEEDWQETRLILRDYAASLDVDLDFQGFDEELATLPGAYAQP